MCSPAEICVHVGSWRGQRVVWDSLTFSKPQFLLLHSKMYSRPCGKLSGLKDTITFSLPMKELTMATIK